MNAGSPRVLDPRVVLTGLRPDPRDTSVRAVPDQAVGYLMPSVRALRNACSLKRRKRIVLSRAAR